MCTISVAYDEAFCFYYEDNFDALKKAGAQLLFFSPMHDAMLPKCGGLYLGGGYPELYAKELFSNTSMRKSIREAVEGGLPTVAECGGFMYLSKSIRDEAGDVLGMTGVFSGESYPTDRARRFGYLSICPEGDSMLFKKGEIIPAHEYHHWDCDACGGDLLAKKANGKSWRFGYVSDTLYAGFPHLHFGGEVPMAKRFVEAVG